MDGELTSGCTAHDKLLSNYNNLIYFSRVHVHSFDMAHFGHANALRQVSDYPSGEGNVVLVMAVCAWNANYNFTVKLVSLLAD